MINSARERVVFLAPGVSLEVAQALASAWARLAGHSVSVIIDADAEVCRLGYGTVEGLKILHAAAGNAGTFICQQPGVRVGLLIADQTTLIYSPTPLLIEAGPTNSQQPNAIELASPPPEVVKDLGLADNPTSERIVGVEAATVDKVKALEQDLERNPPVKFDLARRVRVFTSKFQFVELEMSNCYVSRRKVQIPARLLGVVEDKQLQARLQAHFNLVNDQELSVNDGDDKLTEQTLRNKRKEICERYLISLKGYGNVVLRAHKANLMAEVEELKSDVAKFQAGIKDALNKHIDENVGSLVKELQPKLAEKPPEHYLKFYGPTIKGEEVGKLLANELHNVFDKAVSLVQEMSVSLIFKDLTYESLTDQKFIQVAQAAIPGVSLLDKEFDALELTPQMALQPQ